MSFGVIISNGKVYTFQNPLITNVEQEMGYDDFFIGDGHGYRTRTKMSIELATGMGGLVYTQAPVPDGQDELQQAIELIVEEKVRRAVVAKENEIAVANVETKAAKETLDKIKALVGQSADGYYIDEYNDIWHVRSGETPVYAEARGSVDRPGDWLWSTEDGIVSVEDVADIHGPVRGPFPDLDTVVKAR